MGEDGKLIIRDPKEKAVRTIDNASHADTFVQTTKGRYIMVNEMNKPSTSLPNSLSVVGVWDLKDFTKKCEFHV